MFGRATIRLGIGPHSSYTRNLSGDETANMNLLYDNIFNHFYVVRHGSY